MKNTRIQLLLLSQLFILGCNEDPPTSNVNPEMVFYGVKMLNEDTVYIDTIADSAVSKNWPNSYGIQIVATNHYCEEFSDCRTRRIGFQILNYDNQVFSDSILISWSSGSKLPINLNQVVDHNGVVYITPPVSDTSNFSTIYPITIHFWPQSKNPAKYDIKPAMGYDILMYTNL